MDYRYQFVNIAGDDDGFSFTASHYAYAGLVLSFPFARLESYYQMGPASAFPLLLVAVVVVLLLLQRFFVCGDGLLCGDQQGSCCMLSEGQKRTS